MSRARRRRRIAVVTGTRAEYGLLTSSLRAIHDHRLLDLQLIVTGIHLLRPFGYTIREIQHDGWHIDARVRMQAGNDHPTDQATGLSRGVAGIAAALVQLKSDVVLVLGDRIEAFAAATAGLTTGRIVAHIHGGDVAPGDFDDSLRHALTKLAHLHFPATQQAARRIIRLGEEPTRVHVVGAPGLDRLRELLNHEPPPTNRSQTALIIYHAYGRPPRDEQRTMTTILNTTRDLGLRRIISFPNTDRGHRGVIAAIKAHQTKSPPSDVQVHRSLPRDEYLRNLLHADVLIGNSSSGIIEAPLAGTPSVNVGPRQAGRQPGGRSVIQVKDDPTDIRRGLQSALRKRPRPGTATVYGDGNAGRRIADLLATFPLSPDFTRKTITY